MFSTTLFALAAVLAAVNAQSTSTAPPPTSSPGDSSSPCVYACILPAAVQNGCSGIEDLPCVCRNAQFQSDAGACLQQHCPPGDLQIALQLQQQACSAGGFTPSFTATPTPRPVSFNSVPASPTGSGSSGSPSIRPGPTSSGPSVSRSATASVAGASTPSAAAGTSPQAGAGVIFGVIFAALFAL